MIVEDSDEENEISTIFIDGSPNSQLNGQYSKSDNDINGLPHYERTITAGTSGGKFESIHLYWSGSQWILHKDTDPTANFDNLLAYAKVKVKHPIETRRSWYVKVGKSYESAGELTISTSSGSLLQMISRNSIEILF